MCWKIFFELQKINQYLYVHKIEFKMDYYYYRTDQPNNNALLEQSYDLDKRLH